MNCPKCVQQILQPKTIQEIEVDTCPQCHGIWFDDHELEHLLDLSYKALKPLLRGKESPEANARHGKCPRDGTRLLRVTSAHDATLILDTCVECKGVWLDGGELRRLVQR